MRLSLCFFMEEANNVAPIRFWSHIKAIHAASLGSHEPVEQLQRVLICLLQCAQELVLVLLEKSLLHL